MPPAATDHDVVRLPGGTFTMGSDRHYAEEAPARAVTVDGFAIDRYAVTNAKFSAFVEATGYVTVAEVSPDPALYPGAPGDRLAPQDTHDFGGLATQPRILRKAQRFRQAARPAVRARTLRRGR